MEEGGVARTNEVGATKVVEVPKGKSAQKISAAAAATATAAASQQQQLLREQTTKVPQDVRIAAPPVRVAVEDMGTSVDSFFPLLK